MRYSASDKYEIIRLVEDSNLSIRQTLTRLDIHRSTFYHWLQRYQDTELTALRIESRPQLQNLTITIRTKPFPLY